MTTRILLGDCRAVLATLSDASVHCCVTSPPYWGLRSYLPEDHRDKALEIGSEPTLQLWVQTMVEVFREVRRVLREDGTLWLNLGDAYAGTRGSHQGPVITGKGKDESGRAARAMTNSARRDDEPVPRSDRAVAGLKPKDMMGQPWRVAFALQDDGWFLRQEIIWHKPNPMPESARDRCTKAHEHIFLLSKSAQYFYDFEAMQEPVSGTANARRATTLVPAGWAVGDAPHTAAAHQQAGHHRKSTTGVGFGHGYDKEPKARVGATPKASTNASGSRQNESFSTAVTDLVDTRNPRSVWTIPTHGFKGAHFATFPPALAERCITAGCPVGGTVLDPFGGSGTVGLAADRQHKHAVLIDLDERNLPMARDRITGDAPLFAEVSA